MQQRVAELGQLLSAYAERHGLKVKRGKGCAPEDLARLEAKIAWTLPSSYRAFLEVANGVKLHDADDVYVMNLFPSKSLPRRVDDNQRETLAEDGFDLKAVLVVGEVPTHNAYVLLDKLTGEVVKWVHFESRRFATFDDYLAAEIESLRALLASTAD